MDLLEYQGKAPLPGGRLAGAASLAGARRGAGGRSRRVAGSAARGQGAGARRRARQGGRASPSRAPRGVRGRGVAASSPSRSEDKPVAAVLLEEAVDDRARVLPRHHPEPPRPRPCCCSSAPAAAWTSSRWRARAPEALLRAPIDPLAGLSTTDQVRDARPLAAGSPGRDGRAGLGERRARPSGVCSRPSTRPWSRSTRWCVTGGGAMCLPRQQGDDRRQRALAAPRTCAELRDREPTTREREPARPASRYVSLDGDIGVLGNGAGLVMSTLDLIDAAGGRAADFCDVGGGAQRGLDRRRAAHHLSPTTRVKVAAGEHLRRHHARRRSGAGL